MLDINNGLYKYLTMPLEITMDCIIFIGIFIIFVVFRDRVKPQFVRIIWVLLCLIALASIL